MERQMTTNENFTMVRLPADLKACALCGDHGILYACQCTSVTSGRTYTMWHTVGCTHCPHKYETDEDDPQVVIDQWNNAHAWAVCDRLVQDVVRATQHCQALQTQADRMLATIERLTAEKAQLEARLFETGKELGRTLGFVKT
jgi:hypothetical protein